MDRHPLSPGGNTLVIFDTCVLLPSRLSDVLFDLMLEDLYFAHWTGDVEAEFLCNWPQVHPDASKAGAKRLKAFQQATNHGHLITGYDDNASWAVFRLGCMTTTVSWSPPPWSSSTALMKKMNRHGTM